MSQKISFKTYRSIDICLFLIIFTAFETLVVLAGKRWFPGQPYCLSLVGLFLCLTQMRWGLFSIIFALWGGLLFCFLSAATPAQYAIYLIGNLFGVIPYLYLWYQGREMVRRNTLKSLLFALMVALALPLGRGLVSFLFGGNPNSFIAFFTTDIISILFTILGVWICRRVDGLFEDQKAYLLRQERDRKMEESHES